MQAQQAVNLGKLKDLEAEKEKLEEKARQDVAEAQELLNTAWTFARNYQSQALLLFVALGRAAERRMDDFNTEQLAGIALAFAKVGNSDASLFNSN